MTRNADLAGAHDQELAAGKLLSVVLEHPVEVVDFGLQRCTKEPVPELLLAAPCSKTACQYCVARS
jgi:hypothetical protein